MLLVVFNSTYHKPKQAGTTHSLIERENLAFKSVDDSFFPRDLNIVALGDSLTSGFGDQSGRTGYSTILESMLQNQRGVNQASVKNFGIGGLRSEQLLEELNRSTIKYSIQKADYVIVTIGGNDVMKVAQEHILDLTSAPFEKGNQEYLYNLNLIITKIQESNPNAKLFFVGIYNPFAALFAGVPEIEQVIDGWNQTTELVLSSYENTYFIPIADVFKGKEEEFLYVDFIHPNELGYKHMANRILTYVSHYDPSTTYVVAELDEKDY